MVLSFSLQLENVIHLCNENWAFLTIAWQGFKVILMSALLLNYASSQMFLLIFPALHQMKKCSHPPPLPLQVGQTIQMHGLIINKSAVFNVQPLWTLFMQTKSNITWIILCIINQAMSSSSWVNIS